MAIKSSHIPITCSKQDISCFYNYYYSFFFFLSIKIRFFLIFFKKNPINNCMEKIDIPSMIERIDNLLKIRQETREMLAAVIGKNKQVFTDWRSKNISPTAVDLYKMAKHLGTTYDYLLLGKLDVFPDDIAFAVAKLMTLSEEQRKPIISIINGQVDYWKNV